MRGTPFLKEGFTKGLNTIASPYTLQEGETRNCMNVVSTEFGAIKKRTGSTLFGNSTGTFVDLAVTDSFERADESPIEKDGKGNETAWKAIESKSAGRIVSNEYIPIANKTSGARYSVAEQNNPAVSVEISKAGKKGFGIWTCLNAAATEGYFLAMGSTGTQMSILKHVEGAFTTLTTKSISALIVGESIGISVRQGIVRGWRRKGGSWEEVLSVADTTFTKGYGGIEISASSVPPVGTWGYKKFAIAEYAAETVESEIISLGDVNVSGSKFLIAQAGGSIYSVSSAGKFTKIGTMTEGHRIDIIQANKGTREPGGPVYISNDTDTPKQWEGAGKELKEWKTKPEGEFIAVPKGKYMVWFNNRVWMAGIEAHPSRVQVSGKTSSGPKGETGDPTKWVESEFVEFDPEDGQPITGLSTCGPYIIVFKAKKTWVIHNTSDGETFLENRKISASVGCISHRSISAVPGGCMFLTPDQGVYMTNGSTMKEMAYNVRPTIFAANPAQLNNACAGYFNNHYYLSYASGGAAKPNRLLDYDSILKSWWLHDLAGNEFVTSQISGENETFLYLAKSGAKEGVVKCFVSEIFTDSGKLYTGENGLGAWWFSPWEPFAYYIFRHRIKAPFLKKRVRMIFFDGSGEIIPMSFRNFATSPEQVPGVVDNIPENRPELPVTFSVAEGEKWGEGEGRWGEGEGIWGEAAETHAARIYAPGVARVWGVGFGNNSKEPFEVDSYAYMVQFRKS